MSYMDPLSATSLLHPYESEKYADSDTDSLRSPSPLPLYSDNTPTSSPAKTLTRRFSDYLPHPSAPKVSLPAPVGHIRSFLYHLLPSFLQARFGGRDGGGARSSAARSAAALDGLRGVAALFVFFFHSIHNYTMMIQTGYGDGDNRWIICLPIIRLWFSGTAMVGVFWVCSGYVLALKPLRLSQSSSTHASLLANLSSSVFRRYIRLVFPAAAVSFITVVTLRLGWWEYARQFATDPQFVTGWIEPFPERKETLGDQLSDWWAVVCRLGALFDWGEFYPSYDPHLWTIPMELNSSFTTFIILLGVARLRPVARLLSLLVLITYMVRTSQWVMFLFLLGTLVASLDIDFSSSSSVPSLHLTTSTTSIPLSISPHFAQYGYYILFTLGLHLLSSACYSHDRAWGYSFLYATFFSSVWHAHPHHFFHAIGAALVLLSVSRAPALQRPFNTPFAQYLGRISFSFYLVHGPVLHTVGYSLVPNVRRYLTPLPEDPIRIDLEKETVAALCASIAVGVVVCLPLSLWAADLFLRFVDARYVALARWLENVCVGAVEKAGAGSEQMREREGRSG